MNFFFVHGYVASKTEAKEKMEEKVTDEIKEKIFKSLTDGQIEFKFR